MMTDRTIPAVPHLKAAGRLVDPARPVFDGLPAALGNLGTVAFYPALLDVVRAWMPGCPAQVIHYSRHVAPHYIAAHRTPDADREAYVERWYRFDPMYRRMFAGEPTDFVHLGALLNDDVDEDYITVFFPETRMADDMGMTFPVFDEGVIGVFVQSPQGFSADEVLHFRAARPLLGALLDAHDRTALLAISGGRLDGGLNTCLAVVDEAGAELLRTPAMARVAQTEPLLPEALAALARAPDRSARRLAGGTLTVISPGDRLAAAPGHRLCFYEPGAAAEAPASLREGIGRFLNTLPLTPQQREVLKFVLRGHPSSRIALQLGLSEGTVRNYRKAIHDRLDVTTEREIFQLLLNYLGEEAETRTTGQG